MWSRPPCRLHQGCCLSIQRLASSSMNMACITLLAGPPKHSIVCHSRQQALACALAHTKAGIF
jgi:hypothetical protein